MAQILRYACHVVSPFVMDFQQSSSLEKHLAADDCDSKFSHKEAQKAQNE